MNDYMRHRAGSLHPNPHVHAQWWSKALTKHRHDIRTLESPIKRYINTARTSIPKKLHSQSQASIGTRSKSRPQSAHYGPRGSGGIPQSRPQSAQMMRPMSAGHMQQRQLPGQWDPFRAAVQEPVQGPAHQGPFGAPPREAYRTSPSRMQPQQRHANSDMLLKKVADAFHIALEDLDMVEADVMGSAGQSIALKKRFAMLKIQVADLGKQIDLIRDDLDGGGG